jgi:hypothetical protein
MIRHGAASVIAAIVLSGVARPVFAGCTKPPIGHVVEAKGTWFDDRYQQKIQKGADVCADSLFIRRAPLSDADQLHILPLTTRAETVVFACSEGVTCNGPLNLNRVPISMMSNRRLDDFAAFLKRSLKEWKEDQVRVRNLLHRAPRNREVADAVVLSTGGVVPVSAVLTSERDGTAWMEFCRVRPGENCPNPAQPVSWTREAPTIALTSGFYKVVLGQQYESGYLRTDQQGYILVVDNEPQQRELADLFERARKQVYVSYDEDSQSNLITYLYYLGGGYSSADRP